jgi:hypothetical protein
MTGRLPKEPDDSSDRKRELQNHGFSLCPLRSL